MPLTSGIPLGLLIALIGLILCFATARKKVAIAILGIGLVMTLLTAVLIALVLSSPM
jgi:hypothetical protein